MKITEPNRIPKTTAILMISIAFLFDLLQLGIKAIIFMTAIAGAASIGWIPFFGQAAAGAIAGLGLALDYVFTAMLAMGGYFLLWLWFAVRNVQIFGGDRMARKVVTSFLCAMLEFIPLLSIGFGITVWTIVTIMLTWKEDEEKRKIAQDKHDTLIKERQVQERKRQELGRRIENQYRQDAAHDIAPQKIADVA